MLARVVPVVRTLAPFVAALGDMAYSIFVLYNVVGGMIWVSAHLILVTMAIVALSLVPAIAGWLIEKGQGTRQADT